MQKTRQSCNTHTTCHYWPRAFHGVGCGDELMIAVMRIDGAVEQTLLWLQHGSFTSSILIQPS
jgi:hypothetical protein